jgi:hypothetical protein
MTNDLTDHLFGAPIVSLWTAGFALQSQRALGFKLFQQLKIALFGVTEFTGSLSGTQSLTLALEKHGQLAGNLIIVGQEDGTGMTDELSGRIEELEHWGKNVDKRAQKSNKIWRYRGMKAADLSRKVMKWITLWR